MLKHYLNALATVAFCFGAAIATSHAQTNAALSSDQIDARYDAAQKQCNTLSGDQKDICQKRAEADKDTAQAESKAAKKKAEANHDAAKVRRDSDYDVAMKKCDTLSGDAKDTCAADVKTRYGK